MAFPLENVLSISMCWARGQIKRTNFLPEITTEALMNMRSVGNICQGLLK